MEIRGIKIYIVILVILTIVLGYLGLRYVINIYNIEQPLVDEIKNLNGIKNVELGTSGDKQELILEFSPDADMYKTYNKANETATKILGEDLDNIKVTNRSTKELDDFYYQAHFYLHEGAVTGNFSTMKDNIDSISENYKLDDYKVKVKEENIYFTLVVDSNYIFKMISRDTVLRGSENRG
ncbi:MAG: hypothetical protein ACOCZR_03590 [Halanaerobiales bacterium]